MTLDRKKALIKNNWSFIGFYGTQGELLLSNDGKYIFQCKIQLGSLEADGNLNGRE